MHERLAKNYGRVTPSINSSKVLKEMVRNLEMGRIERAERNIFL